MKTRAHVLASAAVLALGASLSGCASTPAPKSELAVSKAAIDNALAAGGAEYAPVPMKTARDKQERAEKLVAEGEDFAKARYLAEQAALDARAAQATAESVKAQKSVEEAMRNQTSLQQEIDRQQP